MGFDQNDPRPMKATTHKQTTKVNIGVVVGVITFLILAAVALGWMWLHPHETSQGVHESVTEQPAR